MNPYYFAILTLFTVKIMRIVEVKRWAVFFFTRRIKFKLYRGKIGSHLLVKSSNLAIELE